MRILADDELRRRRRKALWRDLAWEFGTGFAIAFGAAAIGWWLGSRSRD